MRKIVFYIGIVCTISPVFAQYDYDFLGKGARAAGMAYAFSSIADDATSISWNPAGMVQLKKPELALANSLTVTKDRYDNSKYKPRYMLDYLGFVYPLKNKLKNIVIGISFQNKMNYKYSYADISNVFGKNDGKNNLTINSLHVGGAYSINRYISAGFSYNTWFSMGNKEYTFDEYYYFPGDNTSLDPDTTHIYRFDSRDSYSGHNFTAGIMLDMEPLHFPLQLALKYEHRVVLKKDMDETYQQDHVYRNYPDTTWIKKFRGVEKYYMPWILTPGISYRIGDYFTIACDLEVRLYNGKNHVWNYNQISSCTSVSQVITPEEITPYADEIVYDKFYSTLHQYRFGAEYILHPKFALIPVRAGWKSNKTSLYDYDKQYTIPKKVTAESLNFGTGLISKHFSVDFAYEHYKYNRINEIDMKEEKEFSFFLLSAIIYLK